MNIPLEWIALPHRIAFVVPVLFLLSAVTLPAAASVQPTVGVTSAALTIAVGLALQSMVVPGLDLVTAVMLVLVCFIALVIARYSVTYLRSDPGQGRYARYLLATLAAVTLLILARDLLVMAAAWTATSLALHQLLTFYPHRQAALVAAHKKFLVSRLADVFLLSAIALIGFSVGSLNVDVVHAWIAERASLPWQLHLAAVFLVVTAALKSAQLPFHGWLTQVMEAPTPVSALLHAGVVNLGGFLMIRMAPLMAKAPVAQTLLVAMGVTTTVVAVLVMSTRVSVKVALAWSTCAQMGFMLVECGLGLWNIALLHLVAHSLYKAHAFLSSGSAVDSWRAASLAPRQWVLTPTGLALSLLLSAAVVGVVYWAVSGATNAVDALSPSELALGFVLALSLAQWVGRSMGLGARGMWATAVRVVAITLLFVLGHEASTHLLPMPTQPGLVGPGLVAIGFGALFSVQTALQARPQGALAHALHPYLFSGLYLDERFTRLTFQLWPPTLSTERAPIRLVAADAQEH